ncbi:hypothetical protein [Actinocorallia longicatena]|uniref:Lipoprotein n=1 Tax=Actinocorallia longicatena TaxID=111803 RepID=A0ABP6Q9J7_9ACTN
MRKIGLSAAALLLVVSPLTGCSSKEKWCEFDATDTVVADSFCEQNTPGYEWEEGSSKTKKKHKKKSSSGTKK